MHKLSEFGEIQRYGECRTAMERDFPKYIDKDILACVWKAGGRAGGNCWKGQDNSYDEPGDPEPAFGELIDYLLEHKPNLSFLHYLKIEQTLVRKSEWTVIEYYGNNTVNGIKFIVVDELNEYLNSIPDPK